jgi:hypothetical protein
MCQVLCSNLLALPAPAALLPPAAHNSSISNGGAQSAEQQRQHWQALQLQKGAIEGVTIVILIGSLR